MNNLYYLLLHLKRLTDSEKQTFQPLVHFPDSLNRQVWAELKPGTRNSTQVYHLGAKYLGHPPLPCPVHQSGSSVGNI